MIRRLELALSALVLVSFASTIADAQYFGRNKVQYEDLDFQILQTEHFDIYYYPEEEEAIELAAPMAERWYERLSGMFDYELHGVQPLILYASHPHFEQTNVINSIPSESTGGVTESLRRRVVMPFAGSLAETNHVLGHELVHAFQYDITDQNRAASAASLRFPLWFIEGMAEYISLGPDDVATAAWIRQAALEDELPTLEDLSDPRYFPYRYGHAFWAYIGGRFGDLTVGRILKDATSGGGVIPAIEAATGQDAESLSEAWHESIRSDYAPLLEQRRTASDIATPLLTESKEGGRLNVAPAISPDGSEVVFLSERDLFSIDMFLADAETGEVKRKLLETATDPHIESLQFVRSAGSFSPDGSHFVIATVQEGQPTLVVIEMDGGDTEELTFPNLGEIFNPSWSPNGDRIVFSAIRGGLLDLYLLDVESEELDRLTDDAFAELQPTWSPDGSRIVFVTDRFTARPELASWSGYDLATLDMDMTPSEHAIARLALFEEADHWNPQWVADGLYFLSDFDGRPNLFRYDPETTRIDRMTDLTTGISGITKLSPAVTVAARADRLLFTVRENDEYRVYRMNRSDQAPVETVRARRTPQRWAALSPANRESSRIASWFARPARGLPEDMNETVEDYDADLDLDYVGQPYLVGGANRFNSFVGGGISFLWGDMLGEQTLGTQVQVTSDIENIAGVVGYENRASRWTWGGSVSRIPFVSNFFNTRIANVSGEISQVEQLIRLRQIETRATGFVAYPFNRSQRVELSSGFANYGFSREADTTAVSLQTGDVLVDETVDLDAPSSLNLGESAAALVYDTSLLGPTSPLLGTRYRFEGGASYGSISYANFVGDFRHYFMPKRPFTLATRVLHYGRYGGSSDDPRLTDLFLGFPSLVRGYQSGSFSAEECGADGGCPVFERLLGSRMLVANVEFRFPLLALFGREPWSGPIPLELAFFGDAGTAWTSDVTPEIFGGDRQPVTSAGMALRVALQRFLVLELGLVRPFDRPEAGWQFEFAFKPGF